uniref:C3H1-type domain-containing protein n=1 Tax=Oryza barthii TaxID=65489 RepID=A0A0D3GM32_9ORYZ
MADSEDGDHAATTTTEQRYDDDGHLVPSSGGQEEEGSGGHDVVVPGGHVAEDYRSGVGVPVGRDAGGATSSPPQPVHVTPSILVGSIHAPVFQGELVGMKFGVGSGSMGAGTSATRRLPATEAGHVSPFLGLPYATAFDSPLDRELVGPSSAPPPCSAASRAWLVRCSSPLSDSEWTRRSILAREAAHTPASTVTGRGRFEFVPIPGAPYAPPPSFAPIAAGAGPAARPLQQLAFGLEEHKTKLCAEYYSRGLGCPRGNTCKYAHGEDDLRLVVAVSSLADAGEDSSSSDSSSPALGGGDKYKTKLCKTFTSGGLCLFAANCRFAHGEVELGKKEPCWYFFTGQTCPRGDTCGFRHSY